jgi:hypothetical protein
MDCSSAVTQSPRAAGTLLYWGQTVKALWVALGDQLGVLQDRTNSIAAALNRLATIREGFDAVRSMLQRVLARGLPTAIKPWDPSSGLL